MTKDMPFVDACDEPRGSSFVLVVDDRTAARNLLLGLVRSLGNSVVAEGFSDPKRALERAAVKKPALIITDYQMPGMDGIEFVESLREIPSLGDIPIIMVTIAEDHDVRLRAMRAGVSEFLSRPIDPIECRSICQHLLRQRGVLG